MKAMSAVAISSVLLASAGCSTAPPSADQLQARGRALVKGMDSSYWALGSTYDVKIKSVDGKSTWDTLTGYAEQMEIPAGHHQLVVICRMVAEVGGIQTDIRETDITTDLTAGRVYQLEPAAPSDSNGCGAKIAEAGR